MFNNSENNVCIYIYMLLDINNEKNIEDIEYQKWKMHFVKENVRNKVISILKVNKIFIYTSNAHQLLKNKSINTKQKSEKKSAKYIVPIKFFRTILFSSFIFTCRIIIAGIDDDR